MKDAPARHEAANDNRSQAARAKPCPICRRPSSVASAPFCSARCADVDLHRWLGGHYSVPAREGLDPEEGTEGD